MRPSHSGLMRLAPTCSCISCMLGTRSTLVLVGMNLRLGSFCVRSPTHTPPRLSRETPAAGRVVQAAAAAGS